jgi:hypothetical protein
MVIYRPPNLIASSIEAFYVRLSIISLDRQPCGFMASL